MLVSDLKNRISDYSEVTSLRNASVVQENIEKLQSLIIGRKNTDYVDSILIQECLAILKLITSQLREAYEVNTIKMARQMTIGVMMHLQSELMYLDDSIVHEVDVSIGLPEEDLDLIDIEELTRCVGDFMGAMGFVYKTENEPVYGSFFQRLKFKTRFKKTGAELNDIYGKAKHALEAKFSSVPVAEATGIYAKAASDLITCLAPFEKAVIRTGGLLVIKTTRNGVPNLTVETISSELSRILDAEPQLLKDPDAIVRFINMKGVTEKGITNSDEWPI